MRERKPRFVPQDVIAEYSALLKTYRINQVVGDKYADGFRFEWQRNGIFYKESEYNKTEIYLRFLPMVLAHRVRMIDNSTLRNQLQGLERKIIGGRETIDHRSHSSAHDDVSQCLCRGCIARWSRWIHRLHDGPGQSWCCRILRDAKA